MNPPIVILINPKFPANVAAAVRACACWGANRLIWTGSRAVIGDGERAPRELRMHQYTDRVFVERSQRPFDFLPADSTPVAVELVDGAEGLIDFDHPENPVYVFGPEDGSIYKPIRHLCHRFVKIPTRFCLNLAATINVVLYDRAAKARCAVV